MAAQHDAVVPFARYNKHILSGPGIPESTRPPLTASLLGNWVQERALQKKTGVSRYTPWALPRQTTNGVYAKKVLILEPEDTRGRVMGFNIYKKGDVIAPDHFLTTNRAHFTPPPISAYYSDEEEEGEVAEKKRRERWERRQEEEEEKEKEKEKEEEEGEGRKKKEGEGRKKKEREEAAICRCYNYKGKENKEREEEEVVQEEKKKEEEEEKKAGSQIMAESKKNREEERNEEEEEEKEEKETDGDDRHCHLHSPTSPYSCVFPRAVGLDDINTYDDAITVYSTGRPGQFYRSSRQRPGLFRKSAHFSKPLSDYSKVLINE
ncbi:hypothetical protein CBR_g39356 [Chara braunii]|uniref:Uncharacterized protein n=1 Tax=Chara braunii TaxID=69332 RepID=A0A388LRL2_CHABU|nr:hypothetical protein CBR_g39356 [Chara braunii]|eukprot:GBG84895.1 hypothetical protein CBR_g39356 [Chara braunii]